MVISSSVTSFNFNKYATVHWGECVVWALGGLAGSLPKVLLFFHICKKKQKNIHQKLHISKKNCTFAAAKLQNEKKNTKNYDKRTTD